MHRGKEFPIEINRQHYVQLMVENLPTLRARLGLNQAELANMLGITRQTLSKWENGLSVPDAQLLLKLAEILEVSVAQLLEGSTETNEEEQDTVAEQLERLNLLLAERNRRSRRIWRIVAGVLIGAAVVTMLLLLLSVIAFRSFTTDSTVSGGEEVVVAGDDLPSYE